MADCKLISVHFNLHLSHLLQDIPLHNMDDDEEKKKQKKPGERFWLFAIIGFALGILYVSVAIGLMVEVPGEDPSSSPNNSSSSESLSSAADNWLSIGRLHCNFFIYLHYPY
jgi:hypothetical protein